MKALALLTAVSLFGGLRAAPVDKTRLYAVDDGAAMRLQWHPKSWAEDQVGYVVKRRTLPSGDWRALPVGILHPAFDPTRDGRTLGMNEAQAADFAAWERSAAPIPGPPGPVDEATLRGMLRQSSGVPMGDLMLFAEEGRIPFVYGLGCVDNTHPAGEPVEYGLFVVRQGDVADAAPLVTVRPCLAAERAGWAKSCGLAVRVSAEKSQLRIGWRMPLAEARRLAIGTFALERRMAGESGWTVLSPRTMFRVENDTAIWEVADPKPGPEGARTYRLVPKDVFRQTYAPYEHAVPVLRYLPPTSENYGPADIVLAKDNTVLRLKWRQPNDTWAGYSLRGYRLLSVGDRKSLLESKDPTPELAVPETTWKHLAGPVVIEAVLRDDHGQELTVRAPKTLGADDILGVMSPSETPKQP